MCQTMSSDLPAEHYPRCTGSKHARSPLGIRDLSARHFLIATGSRPRQIPAYPADGKRIMTSDHIMRADHIPASLAIIGAGAFGNII
jgi:pyruvate/2-oxoglutarate dehydrogenase complex dihydrolipoamide dehydrogenase (E3) component